MMSAAVRRKKRQDKVSDEEAIAAIPYSKRVEEEPAEETRGRSTVSVFSDGTVIALDGFKPCPGPLHHGQILPLVEFGCRRMQNGVIRVQSNCKRCRTALSGTRKG